LCHDKLIDVRHLPEEFQNISAHPVPAGTEPNASRLKLAEADTIRSALRRRGGHLGKTADDLAISRTTLWRKMKRYSISPNEYKS
jgi:transcriptional regulator with PAS, ATPase and Fis domain